MEAMWPAEAVGRRGSPTLKGVRLRFLLAVAVLAGLACSDAVARSAIRPVTEAPLAVLGFQSEGSSPHLIDSNARAMTLVGVDGVDLTGPGRISSPDAAARRQLRRAHRDGR